MNIYLTQPVRKKHDINWHEEYILGLVNHAKTANVSNVLDISNEVMTQATAHKYLSQLIVKGYVIHVLNRDKRVKTVTMTRKGDKVIKELANVSSVPSLVLP